MSHEARNNPRSDESPPVPSPDLRDRVLRLCRQEMIERRQGERRRQSRLRWGLATGMACLLLLNMMEERRAETRITGIIHGHSAMIAASQVAHGHGRLL